MKKVLIRGPILTSSGYGEHARMIYRALKQYPETFDIFIHPLPWGQTAWLWEDNEERREIDQLINKTQIFAQQGNQFDVALLVTIPNEWERVAPITIGVTAGIESSKVSSQWLLKANQTVDKIVVPSEFSANIFKETKYKGKDQFGRDVDLRLEKLIEVIGYPVKHFDSLPDLKLDLEYDFNFLCVAQAGPRKNLEKTVEYFLKTFKDKKVGLVLKINKANNCVRDKMFCEQLLQAIKSQQENTVCKIYLLHGSMTEEEIHSLYVHPKIKCLLSLTHGEGYGLPLFEAAYSGLPIISHEWGGQTDFLYIQEDGKKKAHFTRVEFELKDVQPEAVWEGVIEKDSKWAYPKEYSACTKMMEVYKDHGRFKGQAKKLKEYLLSKEDNVEHKLAEFVNGGEIKRIDFSSIKNSNLPKISFVTSVFKGEEYIEGFMQDIVGQTIFEEKCELVLVNCNSPQKEDEVIKKYVDKYPKNIKYIKLDYDPGIYDAWNMAIKESTGEFVSNANLDDRKAPDFAEKLAKLLVMNPDVDCVYTENLLTQKPHETFQNNSSEGKTYPAEEFSLEAMLRGNPPHCMPMWRKSVHDKNGWFDQKYKSAGDWDFWLRCAFNGSKYLKFGKTLGLYYFNPTGMSTNPENDSWKRQHEKEIYMNYLKKYQERMK